MTPVQLEIVRRRPRNELARDDLDLALGGGERHDVDFMAKPFPSASM